MGWRELEKESSVFLGALEWIYIERERCRIKVGGAAAVASRRKACVPAAVPAIWDLIWEKYMEPAGAHVVIFPYDEHGHATPAFALGRALALSGIRVTLVLTATRYGTCSNMPLHDISGLFHVEAIPDDADDTSHQDDLCFQHSLQKLEPRLEALLLRMRPPPSCLVSDTFYPWSQDLADRLCLPRFHFFASSATIFLLVFHFPTLVSKGLLPFQPGMEDEVIDFIPGLPKDFRLADVPVDILWRDHKHLEVISPAQIGMKRAVGIVINSAYELEPDAMDALSAEGFSVYAVGPMSSINWKENLNHMPYLIAEDEGCLQWLDNQPRGAVVYVAFGSMVSLTEEEIRDVALGLEACGKPFLWVLRCPRPGDMDPMLALPAGFEERTKERGRVIRWAPQTAVLAHPSLGCFLNHCGMGSVLEALWAGVPMLGGFCKVADQNTVLRLATKEWGVALALQDQNLPLRRAVEICVKEVPHGEKGRALSRKALQLKAVLRKAVEPNGSSHLSLSKLVDVIHTHARTRMSQKVDL